MITYVIRTKSNEYYCGKTKCLWKRIIQHEKEKYPHWFNNDKRRDFKVVWSRTGDYEMKIKRFGIKNFVECL